MKYVLILVFLVSLLCVSALTEETVLFNGESFSFSDKNVTLIAIGEDDIVVCVNNEKGIVDDGESFNRVEFNIDKIHDDYVELKLKTDCSDCVCDESCSNSLCFGEEDLGAVEENVTDEVEDVIDVNGQESLDVGDEGVIVGEEKKINPFIYVSLFLFLLLMLILVIFLLKKR